MRLIIVFAPVMRRLYGRLVPMRRSQFELLPAAPDRVVFLGDSITEQGVWTEWFPELDVLNRGIGGDAVGGVTNRLSSAMHQPRAVSLVIGTNDLRKELSGDGTHLNGQGYQVWVDLLRPQLSPFARTTDRTTNVIA